MVVHRGREPDGAAHTVAAPEEHVGQAFTRPVSVTDQPRVDPHRGRSYCHPFTLTNEAVGGAFAAPKALGVAFGPCPISDPFVSESPFLLARGGVHVGHLWFPTLAAGSSHIGFATRVLRVLTVHGLRCDQVASRVTRLGRVSRPVLRLAWTPTGSKSLSSRAPLPHYTRSRTGHARCPSGHHPHATLGGSAPETQQGASGRWLIYFIIVKALRVLYSHTAVSPESSG